MQYTLKGICNKFLKDQKGEACELLEIMCAEPSIEDKIPLLNNILNKLSNQLNIEGILKDAKNQLNRVEVDIGITKSDISLMKPDINVMKLKIENIDYSIFKIKLKSFDTVSNLNKIESELKKLCKVIMSDDFSIDKLSTDQCEKLNILKGDILALFDDIKDLISDLQKNDSSKEITDLLSRIDKSEKELMTDNWLQRIAGVTTIFSFTLQILQHFELF